MTIALVQPGSTGSAAARLAAGEQLTLRRARGADLIVWGESSVGYDISSSPRLLGRLRRLSASVHAQLLVSQDAVSPAGAKTKDALLIGPGGIAGTYVKTRLVPFGEYIPLRSVLGWLTAISRAAPRNMVPGTGAHVLHATLPGGRPLAIGVLICFESAFADMSRADADHGARVIIYQTSDSTFAGSWALAQHASLGAVRAAETGRPVVQAALTGDSAAFDGRGRLITWMGGTDRGSRTVTLALPAAAARTPFDQLGDYVPWSATGIAVAAAVAAAAAAAPGRRRAGRPPRGRPRIGWRRHRPPGRLAVPETEKTARTSGRRARRWLAPAAACAAAALVTAACQGTPPAAGSGPGAGHAGSRPATPSASSPRLTITPGNGTSRAATSGGLSVTASGGTIASVHVATASGPVPGTLNSARTSWRSDWALAVSQRYTVTAQAVSSSGAKITRTSSFRTLRPARALTTMIFEGYRQTYGVGMPIMLTFSQPVVNKKAVERALELRTSRPVVGAWYWDGDKALDFRPRGYWPARTQVSFTGHLDGVEAAPGVYGAQNLTQTFEIGRSLIVVASTATHHLRLYRGGKLIGRWPISTGRPGDDTPNGTYVTIDKGNPVDMVGPGYNIEVPWSVRFTWTGDYLHDAYWSTGEQGFTNVSHGCVNMAPADAQAYYQMEVPGDPVTIVGSPRAGTWDNGWTEWFLSFGRYLRGSALHQAVEAGPRGSTFVSPASLPAAPAPAPLTGPAANNAAVS